MTSLIALGGGALGGIAIHHGLFIHGEWHIQAPNILLGHLLAFALIQVLLDSVISISVTTGYLVSLLSSITIYRAFFHPLRHFPGPFGARISKLWHVWQVRDSKNYRVLDNLHTQYGDFVRTGTHPPSYLPAAASPLTNHRSQRTHHLPPGHLHDHRRSQKHLHQSRMV